MLITSNFHILLFCSDVDDLPHFSLGVGLGADDEQSVQEVNGDSMRTPVGGSTDVGDAPVGGRYKNGRHLILQGTIEEAEALNVQHVHLQTPSCLGLPACKL